MACVLCNKRFIREEEFPNYNPDPKVGKRAISKLFQISSLLEVQGLSEDLVLCLGCHLKLEEVEDLVNQFEDLQRKINEAKAEITQELIRSKDASELMATSRNLDLSQTSLYRLVLLKAIGIVNSRPPTPDRIDAGDPESANVEQNQAMYVSENGDLIDSASGVDGVVPAGAPMPKKAKRCPKRARPRWSTIVEKQAVSNPVPSTPKGGYTLRTQKGSAKGIRQVEEPSDEEGGSDHEPGEVTGHPRKCSECGKCFTRKQHRDRHMKTVHERRRDFKCKGCDNEFVSKYHLKRHMSRAAHDDGDEDGKVGMVKEKRVEVARVINPQLDVNPKVKVEAFVCRMTPSCQRVFKSERSRNTHEDSHAN